MKTIQEVLKECNREEVISCFCYEHMPKVWEIPDDIDSSVKEIKDAYKLSLNMLIDMLINTEPKETEKKCILLAYHLMPDTTWMDDISFTMIEEDDLDSDDPTTWAYEFSPTEEVVGFYVSDAYTTQYYLTELICDFLNEVSFFGWERENMQKELEILKERAEEVENGTAKTIPAEEMFQKIEDDFGFQLEKRDPKEKEEEDRIRKMIWEHNHKNLLREVKKTRESARPV